MYTRKEDTRRKIELGGLVIKAGLAGESAVILLGALLKAAESLESTDGERIRNEFMQMGDAAFRTG